VRRDEDLESKGVRGLEDVPHVSTVLFSFKLLVEQGPCETFSLKTSFCGAIITTVVSLFASRIDDFGGEESSSRCEVFGVSVVFMCRS
jgi:hypothetical protein